MTEAPMDDADRPRDFWSRHLSWRRPFEIILWVLVFGISAVANTAVTLIDAERYGQVLEAWKPATWEGSSALVSLLLLPPLLWFCERWPLHADTWRRRLPAYLVASLLWSLLHVAGMVLLRMAVYVAMGERYDFDWARELPYEYLKDARTFALIVFLAHSYSWLWRRFQGEVRLLATPDPGIPDERAGQGDRPERFLVRKLGREFLVAAGDIEWLQASGNYVNLRMRGHDYPLRSTLSGIESKLDPARFARIHRSYIVNLDQVDSIEPLDSGDARVRMRTGDIVPCSRRYREALRNR
ncbi:LytTR family DNA-binding domain-containing protein [Luteimonas sp. R10]|uniref:LytTR family DNA-binding domain-containing protein n=1 Tax=Luteimonas sp. R10 TaxID=3108176 RepID=UPI00308D66ED|nr:LytTR family DNA-binding domain-containing protein [Luteimonas sp. R10]